MKKLLLTTAACGIAFAATPAAAQVQLEVGGYFKGYGVYTDQDEDSSNTSAAEGDTRDFDMIRDTEIHLGGETTLDNGLTVGMHFEIEADADGDTTTSAGNTSNGAEVQESYAYFSGGWGRVNVGAEDGAQYLLQVSAPAADENIDGIRQYVQPVNYTTALGATSAAGLGVAANAGGIDYAVDATGYADKITYLSPILNGFQLGLSYTPDTTDAASDLSGVAFDDVDNTFGEAYEAALRYEGQFNNVGVIAGAGYTHIDVEETTAGFATGNPSDDREAWNVGLDLDMGPFGIGASYSEDDYGETEITGGGTRDDEETFVVGADYTTGPFKFGVSYLNQDGTLNVAGATGNDGVETDRYSGGVVYTYGPGMTFRGSISYIDHDNVVTDTGASSTDIDATSFLLGTQINF